MKIVGFVLVLIVAVVVAAFVAEFATAAFDLGLTAKGAVFIAVGYLVLGAADIFVDSRKDRTPP